MKAVIIAAGEGKRLHPLTLSIPKPLVKVLNKPLIQYIWETLPKEISEVILVVGYKQEQLRAFIGKEFLGKKVTYVEQKQAMGTAHALGLCREYLEKEEKFLVMYADDLQSRQAVSRAIKYDFAIIVSPVEHPERFGIVVTNPDGTISNFDEKPTEPKSNLAATGVYVLSSKIFNYYQDVPKGEKEYYLTDLIKSSLKDMVCQTVVSDFWVPVGYPEDIENAEKILKELSQAQKNDILGA